jgi:hypothetical protein
MGDLVRMRNIAETARFELDGIGICAFYHEVLKIGIDRAIFG